VVFGALTSQIKIISSFGIPLPCILEHNPVNVSDKLVSLCVI